MTQTWIKLELYAVVTLMLCFVKKMSSKTRHSATPVKNLFRTREGGLQTWQNDFAMCMV